MLYGFIDSLSFSFFSSFVFFDGFLPPNEAAAIGDSFRWLRLKGTSYFFWLLVKKTGETLFDFECSISFESQDVEDYFLKIHPGKLTHGTPKIQVWFRWFSFYNWGGF